MTGIPSLGHLWIIGPGRLGLALGWQLLRSGSITRLSVTGRRRAPPVHPLFDDQRSEYLTGTTPVQAPAAVIICVPDDAILTAAQLVAAAPTPPAVTLHTSGVLGSDLLREVLPSVSAPGSFHPLVAVPDPIAAAGKLNGAWYGIEGSEVAVEFCNRMVAVLQGQALHIPPGGKGLYHAGAVFASNFVVGVLEVGLRLLQRAGVRDDVALAALSSLAAGSVEDVGRLGPKMALTGPVARGDAGTVALHLARLSGDERALYSVLAREVLAIATSRGLDHKSARTIIGILEGERS